MKLIKIMLLLIIPILFLYGSCTWTTPCPYDFCEKIENYPYEQSLDYDLYCGPANVRMWALYDRKADAKSQTEIAEWFVSLPTNIYRISDAVSEFTDSMALPALSNIQNENTSMFQTLVILNRAVEGIANNIPSIFIFESVHSETLVAFDADYDNEQVIAKNLYFYDPNWVNSKDYPSGYSHDEFLLYWKSGTVREAVIGITRFGFNVQDNSAENLKEFIRYNGTYYGGPVSYIPEGSEFVRIFFPRGGDKLSLGDQKNIIWESNGLTGNIKLELLKGDIYLGTIATNLPITQASYSWIVGQYQGGTATVGDDFKIKITMMDGSDYDTSNVDFSITPQLPDVIITNITMIPAAPTPGENVTIKATIKNQGLAATPNGIDVGTAIKVDGAYIGAFFVKDANGNHKALAAGESYQGTCNAQWTATVGTHTLWAMADDVDRFSESDESNNVKESSCTIANLLPDVIVTNILLNPATPIPGQQVTVRATIKNQGVKATPAWIDVAVAFKIAGTYLGAFFVKDANGIHRSLIAGESYTGDCTTQWTAVAGTRKFWAMADDVNRFPESNEGNNVFEKNFTIANPLPDVVIEDIWLEPPASGSNYKIHARIKNIGTAATPTGSLVGVGFTVDGTYLGAFFVEDANGNKLPLAAGASFNGICTTPWVKVTGTHSFKAIADDVNRFSESNEGNNTRTESIAVQ